MRDTILNAAAQLFAQWGPNISLDEIAVAIGITQHQLRVYFTSPAAIRRALGLSALPGSTRRPSLSHEAMRRSHGARRAAREDRRWPESQPPHADHEGRAHRVWVARRCYGD